MVIYNMGNWRMGSGSGSKVSKEKIESMFDPNDFAELYF
jgi:hypothetical protein